MIEVESVSKSYRKTLAVDRVGFTVRPGEIVGFVGPNGAGKSTVMKMIATYLEPDGGRIRVCGRDTVRESFAVRARIGYMPERSIAYDGMRVDRFLKFAGEAHGLRGSELKERFEWVVDRCRLGDALGKRVGECSKGYQRRVALAMSLIHDPGVLLMDEPTHGMDPLQVLALRELVRNLKQDRAILFSTHIIQEVAAVCDRVLVINDARLLADGTPVELAAAAGVAATADCEFYDAPAAELGAELEGLPGCAVRELIETAPGAARAAIELKAEGMEEALAEMARRRGWELKSYVQRPIDLEDVFARIVGREGK